MIRDVSVKILIMETSWITKELLFDPHPGAKVSFLHSAQTNCGIKPVSSSVHHFLSIYLNFCDFLCQLHNCYLLIYDSPLEPIPSSTLS
jgi:hypothetical protein